MLREIFSLSTLWWFLLIGIYLPCCIGLTAIVLLQKGKGAGFAGAFGLSPGSESVFGPKLARTLPQKLTYIGAGIFMVLAIVLSALSGIVSKGVAPEHVTSELTADESKALDELFSNQPQPSPTTPVIVEEKPQQNTPPLESSTNLPSSPANQSTSQEQTSPQNPTPNQ
ncbi:MAG: preprotein translocase subunit SecG [Candidatus Hydrogenedentes bacterium]|nr:preprotein translocase subunit SecG [Candidatus Hydrogenedentota bacterium]